MDKAQLQEAVKEMDEALKSYLPEGGRSKLNDAFKIDPKTSVYVNDLAKQYELLAQELDVAKEAYKKMRDISGVLENANSKTSHWYTFDDSFRGNAEDYIEALKKWNQYERQFIIDNRDDISAALKKTKGAFDDYRQEVEKNIALFKSTNMKEGFGETDLNAQYQLLKKFPDAWNNMYEQVYYGSSAWSEYMEQLQKVDTAHSRMESDLSTFAESAKKEYTKIFGLPVEKWTRAHQLAVQKDLELFLATMDGYSSMAEDERIKLEKELLAPMKIPMDVDAREANKALTEMQAYLEGLVGHNWVVTLKLQTVGSFEQLYDQLDKDVKDGMATMKKLGTEFTAKRRKELQNMAIDTKTLTGSEKEYAEAYQKTEKAKETAAKKNWKLSSLEKQNAKAERHNRRWG